MCKNRRVLAIIVTYNGLQNSWIQKCLDSLLKSTLSTDIIVIDNNSIDDTANFIKHNYPVVRLIASATNLGFGKANNIGLNECINRCYDYAFLLNQDAWVEENAIEKLVYIAEKNPDYGILSPMHLNGTGSALDFNFSNYIAQANGGLSYSDLFLQKTKPVYSLQFVNAAAWLVSRACIEKAGGFSPTFYHYAEDDNYCHRVTWHGLKIGIVPDSCIFHDRENRESKSSLKYKWAVILRNTHLEYANPNHNKIRLYYHAKLLKFAIKNPIFLMKFLSFTSSNNWRQAKVNKIRSKAGKAFLNE